MSKLIVVTGAAGALGTALSRHLVARGYPVAGGLQLHVRGNDRILPRIAVAAERGGFNLVDVSVNEPSLETVFIDLTGKELRE